MLQAISVKQAFKIQSQVGGCTKMENTYTVLMPISLETLY